MYRRKRISKPKSGLKKRLYAKKRLVKKAYKGKARYANKAGFYGNIKKIANTNMTESRIYQRMRPDRLAKNIEKVGQPQAFVFNKAGHFTNSEGRQAAVSLSTLSGSDLRQILTFTHPQGSTPGTGAAYVKRAVLERLVGTLEVTNSSTCRAIVDIYDIIRIRDSQGGSGFTNGPVAAWDGGLQEQDTNYSSPVGDAAIVGSLPTDSDLFKQYFKIIKKTSLVMEQGATHRHMISRTMNKLIDNNIVGGPLNAPVVADVKPYVMWHLIVFRGQVVAADSGDDTFAYSTVGEVRLDTVLTYRAKYTQVSWNSPTFTYDNTALLPTLTTDAIVNAGSGAIEAGQVVGGKV